ncbi:MAG: hypothetical protein PVF95_00055 [bacterium]|jgi:hypothetical protein
MLLKTGGYRAGFRLSLTLRAAIAAIAVLALSTPLWAQDSHYWTLTYGARASLLGGALIGSVMDLSATYYNPGALPLTEDLDVVMTSTVFNYPNVWMKDIGGTDIDIRSSNLNQVPIVVAGMFKVDWHGSNRLGYSVLTRHRVRLDFYGSVVQGVYDLPDTIDLSAFAGDLNLNEELSETWVGLCWARRLRSGIGFGLTAYGTFRNHDASLGVSTQALDQRGNLACTQDIGYYRYSDYGILVKMGVSFGFQGISCGLTLTTPNLSVYSDAKVGTNHTKAGYETGDPPNRGDYMAVRYQEGLKAHHKMPLSLGAGANYSLDNTSLHFSVEYFFPVDEYDVISAGDFVGQTHGDTLSQGVTHAARGVLNFGLGIEQTLGEDVKAYASFSTDFSSKRRDVQTNLSVSDWDIYSIMIGSTFRVMKARFTLGLGLGWGSELRGSGEPVAIGGDEGASLIREASFKYRMYKFVLGFSF